MYLNQNPLGCLLKRLLPCPYRRHIRLDSLRKGPKNFHFNVEIRCFLSENLETIFETVGSRTLWSLEHLLNMDIEAEVKRMERWWCFGKNHTYFHMYINEFNRWESCHIPKLHLSIKLHENNSLPPALFYRGLRKCSNKLNGIKPYDMDLSGGILYLESTWQQGEILRITLKRMKTPLSPSHFSLVKMKILIPTSFISSSWFWLMWKNRLCFD